MDGLQAYHRLRQELEVIVANESNFGTQATKKKAGRKIPARLSATAI
jgi:hypothetical protein